jgi:uncharacterized protein (TIGR02646 family)
VIGIRRLGLSAPLSLLAAAAADLSRIEQLAKQGVIGTDDFKGSIYASEEVKEALWEVQGHKCCFCESRYERKWATVEHFRPKTQARRGDGTVHVGYWWLSYDFQNLHFACPNCNTPKGDYFPLEPGTAPLAPGEHPDTHAESPLLLDPGRDDPARHLTFTRVAGGFKIMARTERGRQTIKATKLDRDDLDKLRSDHYKDHIEPVIKVFKQARRDGDNDRQAEAVRRARQLTRSRCSFALFTREVFRHFKLL